MARLLIYDAYENKVYTYANLNENDPMPYSTLTTLRLREFRGKSNSPVLWTTIAAMEAWNLTRRKYGRGIPVGYAFRRIWEGGHGTRSQHYAGVAFDVGQSLDQRQRTAIYNAARATGAWGYVEPLSQTPTWVHMDRRYGTPACRGTTAGYPTLRRGSRGCYVMDITGYAKSLWNSYRSAKEELGADAPWDELKEKIKNRTIYLGPEAYSVYTTTYSVLQGMTPDGVTEEDVPIKIDVTYNLIK